MCGEQQIDKEVIRLSTEILDETAHHIKSLCESTPVPGLSFQVDFWKDSQTQSNFIGVTCNIIYHLTHYKLPLGVFYWTQLYQNDDEMEQDETDTDQTQSGGAGTTHLMTMKSFKWKDHDGKEQEILIPPATATNIIHFMNKLMEKIGFKNWCGTQDEAFLTYWISDDGMYLVDDDMHTLLFDMYHIVFDILTSFPSCPPKLDHYVFDMSQKILIHIYCSTHSLLHSTSPNIYVSFVNDIHQ